MHVHATQFDPNLRLNYLQAIEAKKEAARTRRKLLDASSHLGEYENDPDCVVRLGARDESNPPPEQRRNPDTKQPTQAARTEESGEPFSDFA